MIETYDIHDVLTRLVDRSLVTYDQEAGRFYLLETVRQYASEHALNNGDSVLAREAHAAYFSELAKDANVKVRGPKQLEWLQIFDAEYDNIRLALEWRASSEDHLKEAITLASSLLDYWLVRGYYHEIAYWVAKLRENGEITADEDLARILLLEQTHAQFTGLPFEEVADKALEHALRSGDEGLMAVAYCTKAFGVTRDGDESAARALSELAFPLLRKHGNTTMESFLHMNLGNLYFVRGELDMARAEYLAAFRIRRGQQDTRGLGASMGGLAEVTETQGDFERAADLWKYSVATFQAVASRWDISGCLPGLCMQLRQAGEYHRAAQILGCADALQEQIGSGRDIADSAVYQRHRSALQKELSKEEFERAYAEGRRTSWQRMLQILYPEGLKLPSERELEAIEHGA